MNRFVCILILSLFCIQCEESNDKDVPLRNVSGKYIYLDAEEIALFVPEGVKTFTDSEHIAMINNIEDPKIRQNERKRYAAMKYGAEDFYLLQNEDKDIHITYVSVPYIEINQETSQQILKFINRRHKSEAEFIGLESSFSRAGILKFGNDRVFRAIFIMKGINILTNMNELYYTHFYLANRKGKTFMITYNSKKAYDFDSYFQKIRL